MPKPKKIKMPFKKQHLEDEHMCPRCGEINTGRTPCDDTGCQAQAISSGSCATCKLEWTDVYVLANVIPEET